MFHSKALCVLFVSFMAERLVVFELSAVIGLYCNKCAGENKRRKLSKTAIRSRLYVLHYVGFLYSVWTSRK